MLALDCAASMHGEMEGMSIGLHVDGCKHSHPSGGF
jgi:hypothetical protein